MGGELVWREGRQRTQLLRGRKVRRLEALQARLVRTVGSHVSTVMQVDRHALHHTVKGGGIDRAGGDRAERLAHTQCEGGQLVREATRADHIAA